MSTADREVAQRAINEIEFAYDDMVRIFGKSPQERVAMMLLRNKEHYARFASGEESLLHPLQLSW